jgi:hypothetical protein
MWRLILGVTAMVVAVLGALGAASAHATVDQGLGAGPIVLTASSSAPLFDLPAMAPGGRWRKALTIRNTGSLASWRLDRTTGGNRALLGRLELTVFELRKGERRCVFDGPLGSLRSVKLGMVAARASRMFVFVVRWPRSRSAPSSTTARAAGRVDFSWTATSV